MFKKMFIIAIILMAATLLFQNKLTADTENSIYDVTQGSLVTTKDDEIIECPLKHTKVKADISGFIADVEVTQEFKNPFNTPIEAIYVFPLPHNASVNSMEIQIDDRNILGFIEKKEEARKIYEEAKKEGYLTGLLEQKRPSVFSQSLANIKEGSSIRVKIRYTEVLEYDGGNYEFVFPVVVGPRYNPPSLPESERIDLQYLEPGERTGHDISLEVHLNAGIPLKDITSPSHEINISKTNENEALISLKEGDKIPNKDFVLNYKVAGEKPECAVISTVTDDSGYFTLIVQPKAVTDVSEITPKEMVFLLDRSGSMAGKPLDTSKEVIKKCLEGMNPGDTFQIISFAASPEYFSQEPLENTPGNINKGLEYIDTLKGEGPTNMLEGIKAVFNYTPDPGRMRIIFFLTDGYIGNEKDILTEINENIGETRLFSLGVGSAVNRYLLESMAEVGRGKVQYVRDIDDSTEVANKFYERISAPYFTDITVDWKGLDVEEVYPAKIPDLFSSQPLFIYGKYDGPSCDTIEIKGKIAGKDFTLPVPVELKNSEENKSLALIWAKEKIKELELGQLREEDPDRVNEITSIALKFGLMSEYTSFIVVEKSEKVDTNGELQSIMVPLEIPEGLSTEGFEKSEEVETDEFTVVGEPVNEIAPEQPPQTTMIDTTNIPFLVPINIKNEENLRISLNDNGFKLITDFSFRNSSVAIIKVKISRDGRDLAEFYPDTDCIKVEEAKSLVFTFIEGRTPFTGMGKYDIDIEVYNGEYIIIGFGQTEVEIVE